MEKKIIKTRVEIPERIRCSGTFKKWCDPPLFLYGVVIDGTFVGVFEEIFESKPSRFIVQRAWESEESISISQDYYGPSIEHAYRKLIESAIL